LKAHTGNNLQYEFFWGRARCKNGNTKAWEQMILLKTNDGKYIIQSRWNNRNLQVRESGECVFANHNQGWWEKFTVEYHDNGSVFFISCHTGKALQCDANGFVNCVHQNCEGWEAWKIIDPETTEMMNLNQLLDTVAAAATGLLLVPGAFGAAAILQAVSVTLAALKPLL
jgi:hypothetical protein